MVSTTPDTILDEILSLQILVAWAGEGACEPKRLGWWKTDVVDRYGGGDLMQRLLPKTHEWASLETVREAAIRADKRIRNKMADSDKMRTLFFLGFDLDEELGERLAHHKRSGKKPHAVLDLKIELDSSFDRSAIENTLTGLAEAKYKVAPGGRRLEGHMPDAPERLIRNIAAALAPLADEYPMPYYSVK